MLNYVHFTMKRKLTVACIFIFLSASAYAETDNMQEIVSRMTLQEKASCVVGMKRELFPPTNDGFCARTTPFPAFDVPSLVLADGTAGVRLSRRGTDRATAFPDNMALASSWDRSLVQEVGAAVGFESRGYNVNVQLAPGMNIIRNPLCGRCFEYYSEDPFISGKLGAAYVSGIQSNGVAASAKHFTCNNQETNRTQNDVRITERALREIYLKGFEICVKEADPWTVMSSYNSLNGSPVQETRRLLTDILRDEWGFKGLVMTDWSISKHNTAAQLHAGNDLFMPGRDHQVKDIIDGVNNGSIRMEDLDRACLKVLELGKKCYYTPSTEKPDLKKGEAVSLKAACESAVLLENNGMLPITDKNAKAALFGVRSYDMVVTGSGAGFVACSHVSQICDAFKNAGTSIDAKLEDLYTKYVAFTSADIKYNEKVKVHIGLPLLPELEISEKLIGEAAENNDYAIITIGRTAEEGKERELKNDYYLSETEKNLIVNVCNAFHDKGKKVAVILNVSGVVDTESWKRLPDAILNIWLPGQEGGKAVYALLSGEVVPSGRLAVTFPKDYFDLPSAREFPYNHPTEGKKNFAFTNYSEGVFLGYRYFCTENIGVSYPFGHGLSYTDFEYSSLKVKKNKESITICFSIKNTGHLPGKEAVGIYFSAPGKTMDKPAKELKAFAKTGCIAPGDSETVCITVPVADLSSYNESSASWEVEKGNYLISVGADCTGTKLSKIIKIN